MSLDIENRFITAADCIGAHAAAAPTRLALVDASRRIDCAMLDRLIDRCTAALQRDGSIARVTMPVARQLANVAASACTAASGSRRSRRRAGP